MRKLDLRDLGVEIDATDAATGADTTRTIPVMARASYISLLFSDNNGQGTGLGFEEALARQELAQRIRKCAADDLLLDEADFQRILSAFNAFRNYNQFTVLLAARVKATPDVAVVEKIPLALVEK